MLKPNRQYDGVLKAFYLKYQRVLLPLILALVMDLSLLSINYVLAVRLEQSAMLINLAGRQRMLSQRISKSVALMYHGHQLGGSVSVATRDELAQAADLFQLTLQAFISGAHTFNASGQSVYVEAIQLPASRQLLAEAQELWAPVHSLIELALREQLADAEVAQLLETVIQQDQYLLTLMNRLTVQLEEEAADSTLILRYVQTVILSLVLLLFTLSLLRLARIEKYYSTLMEASTDIVLSVDINNEQIKFLSKSVEPILGYPVNHFLRRPLDRLFSRRSMRDIRSVLQAVKEEGSLKQQRLEAEVVKADRSVLVVDCVMNLARDERGKSLDLLVDIRDITERKAYEVKLQQMAMRDALTKLPNRHLFFDLAEKAVERAVRHDHQLALLFIDLDGFKQVNDAYGHHAGDKLLKRVADKLVACFRQSDVVCRMGGDEFVVLVDQLQDVESLQALCEKVIASLSKEEQVDGYSCRIGASIGVSIFDQDGSDIRQLMTHADKAMYQVKQSGKGGFEFAS